MIRYRFVAVFLALLLSAAVLAANDIQVWPPLSEFDAVSGRAATNADVQEGRAVFLLQAQNGVSAGKPLRIVGAIDVESGQALVGLLQEFRLLGTAAPD